MAESEDRTQEPSSRRLQKAREEGNVLQSREVLTLGGMGAGLVMLLFYLPGQYASFMRAMAVLMFHAGDEGLSLAALGRIAMRHGLALVVPVGGFAAVATVVLGLFQTGFLLRPEGIMPDMGRISPMKGLTRIFGTSGLMEGGKALLKIGLLGALVYGVAHRSLLEGLSLVGVGPMPLCGTLLHAFARLSMTLLAGYVVIAGLDVFWRFRHRLSKLRMSRQELKDEYRETEGDPHIKGRIRQLRMRMARQQMMKAVKRATVVVTNPTHYAVALVYERGAQAAPKIVAKGVDEMAARIREVAMANHVPIVPNPPLARALYPLPLDTEVPVEHFRVVAAIIAYVWRIRKGQGVPAGK